MNLFADKKYLAGMLGFFLLMTAHSSLASLPDFSLKLPAGCAVLESSAINNQAAGRYQAVKWFQQRLNNTDDLSDLAEYRYFWDLYRNSGSAGDKSSGVAEQRAALDASGQGIADLRSEAFAELIDYLDDVVDLQSRPEEGNILTIASVCARLVPVASSSGFALYDSYQITRERSYNAPLLLSDMRMSLGTDTLIVFEYYKNSHESALRVVNSGLAPLTSFVLKLGGTTLFSETIPPRETSSRSISRRSTRGLLESEEASGLTVFPVNMLGKDKLLP